MAKGVVALVSALFLLAVVHSNADEFTVEGEIYCDPCRIKFKTELAKPLPGGVVVLQCRNSETNNLTYEVQGKADNDGKYTMNVVGDHQDDICEVFPMSSPSDTCHEKIVEQSKVECSNNTGMTSNVRYVNPLGFMETIADPKCQKFIKDMGLKVVDGEVKDLDDDDDEENN